MDDEEFVFPYPESPWFKRTVQPGHRHRQPLQQPQDSVQKLFGANASRSPKGWRRSLLELRTRLLAQAEQAASQLSRKTEPQATRNPIGW